MADLTDSSVRERLRRVLAGNPLDHNRGEIKINMHEKIYANVDELEAAIIGRVEPLEDIRKRILDL